jgi:peroxiredoxin
MKAVFTSHTLPLSRRTAALSALIGLSLIVLMGAPGSSARDKVGKLPKDSVARHQVASLDGRQFSLAALRGQVVVLDFFAVWCSTSRAHLPSITRFTDDDRQRGLQIIGLAVQERTTKEQLEQFISEQKLAYPVGWISDSAFSQYVDSRDVSVPQTLIYGRDGRLQAHFNGHSAEIDAAIAATVKRELEKK